MMFLAVENGLFSLDKSIEFLYIKLILYKWFDVVNQAGTVHVHQNILEAI